jgi:hypothetical protein
MLLGRSLAYEWIGWMGVSKGVAVKGVGRRAHHMRPAYLLGSIGLRNTGKARSSLGQVKLS